MTPRPPAGRLSANVLMAPKWDLGECLSAWERHGIGAIGVTRSSLEAYGRERGVGAIQASGLGVANYQQVDPLRVTDPDVFVASLPETLLQLDVAAAINADCVYVISGPRGALTWDEAAARLVDQVQQLLPVVRERGLRLALEPLHPLRQDLAFLNTARDTVEVLTRIGDPAVGYAFDTWHLWWQRDALELARTSAALVVSVQISDHKAVTMRTLDRAMPGQGIAPLPALVAALEAGGYRGYYELEVISDDNETKGYDAALDEAVAGWQAVWEQAAHTAAAETERR